MTPRRRPHCHTCGAPMAGHRRQSGVLICPDSSGGDDPDLGSDYDSQPDDAPPSPPPSPPRPLGRYTEIEIPEDRPWHRRNPNWVDPQPVAGPSRRPRPLQAEPTLPQIRGAAYRPARAEREGSYVSTVLGSDIVADREKNNIARDNSGRGGAGRAGGSREHEPPFDANTPLASVFRVTARDVPTAQRTARNLGLHTGLIPKPRRPDFEAKRLAYQPSWWMVVGKSGQAVRHLLDAHQREMPGNLEDETRGGVQHAYAAKEKRGPGFLQLMLAGAIGGLIVVYGLSLL